MIKNSLKVMIAENRYRYMELTQKSMSFQYKLGNAAKVVLNWLFLKKSIKIAKNISAKMTSSYAI